jgi:hypothetical protein
MPAQFTLPGDTQTPYAGNPPGDMNAIVDALAAQGATRNGLNAVYSGGADPLGSADSTAAINGNLAAAAPGETVTLPAGTYKISAPLVVPNFVGLSGPTRAMCIPIGNYGIGGLAVKGAVIKPSSSFSGAGVISLLGSASQGGGQNLRNLTIDGTALPAGTVHGIYGHGGVAGVTLRDCLVYGLTGNGLHCDSDGTSQPDFWHVLACKFSGCAGDGVHITGLADSWFTDCEATGNTGDGWDVTSGNNARFTSCKGEGNGGFGWNLQAASGFTGVVQLSGSTAESNTSGGFTVSGTGAGLFRFPGCRSSSNTTLDWSFSGSNAVQQAVTADPTFAPADLGLLGQSFDPSLMQGNGDALTSGQPQLVKIPVRDPIRVSKVRFYVVAGGTCTSGQCFAGLYSAAGAKLGGSADQAATWQATTNNPVDCTLTSGPFLASPPWVWAMLLWNGTATTFGRSFNLNATLINGALAAAAARYAHNGSAQTSLPASITPASNVPDVHALYAALL